MVEAAQAFLARRGRRQIVKRRASQHEEKPKAVDPDAEYEPRILPTGREPKQYGDRHHAARQAHAMHPAIGDEFASPVGGKCFRRGGRGSRHLRRRGDVAAAYCMNQPWETTMDWPVSALLSNPAKNRAVAATSATVVNSPSTVSFNITFLITSASEMPNALACSGICFSTSGVRTKPGQITLALTPCTAPS